MTKPTRLLSLSILFALPLAACGAVDQMADDDTIGDDDVGAPDAALDPAPDAPPPPECISDAQCSADEPACGDDQTCHGCTLDAQCASGACDFTTGACLAEAQVLYVAPGAWGTCTRAAPCGRLGEAVPRVTPTRKVIVLAPGDYFGQTSITSAPVPFIVHGEGARLTSSVPGTGSATLSIGGNVSAALHRLTIDVMSTGSKPDVALACAAAGVISLDRVTLRGDGGGLGLGGGARALFPCELYMTRSVVHTTGIGIEAISTYAQLDRSVIIGAGWTGVALLGSSFRLTNNVIARSRGYGILVDGPATQLPGPQLVRFNTIAENGEVVVNDGTEIQCRNGASALLRNNIFRSTRPYGATRAVAYQCAPQMSTSLVDQPGYPSPAGTNVIAPSDLAGTGAVFDARLTAGSPAIDAADPIDASVIVDAEGLPRPVGPRSDLGAHEFRP